ncbi:MAG TPA: TIGR01777 family oxidoreductase [Armatimonadota bacterium]|jgi:hypothetical protein
MRVAITGATGFIGRALTAALTERGDSVVAFTRPGGAAPARDAAIQALPWPPGPGEFPAVDAVVHLAGESVAGRWTDAKKQAIRASRVEGARQLLAAMARATRRPSALVSASAVGYYGDRGEESLSESAPPGADFLAEVCRAWEAEAERAEEIGLRVCCIRTGIVLGHGGALQQMLPPFRMGLGGPMGSGRQWFPWVQLDDIVALYLHALDTDVSGPINGVGPTPIRQGDFARALGAALHRPAILPTPKLALRLLYGEFADTLFCSQKVIPEKAIRTGFRFRFHDAAAALAASL